MKKLSDISSVYFLGIGGIGMSALARYFTSRGIRVSGYDKTETVLTKQLVAEGMTVHYDDNLEKIDREAELVIVTPAVPQDHSELIFFKNNGYTVKKRSEVLGMITGETFSICLAGTHVNITTSSLIAHILRHSGYGCNAFLGGITANYGTNFWSHEKAVSVAEADEYDRSFLQLSPDMAVITSMDPDHLDIYGTAENLQDAFVQFANRLKEGGYLVYKYGLPRTDEFRAGNIVSYSLDNPNAAIYASRIEITGGRYLFDVTLPTHTIHRVELNMGGMHNIENAVAAMAIAGRLGISDDKIKAAVADFNGVKRRFEYIIRREDLVMIDDYAHHPEELRALISGAKELYPGMPCTVVFQPHLFSRTNDLADGFADALGLADELLLLPIYPARELPMPGVTSRMIADRMKGTKIRMVDMNELVHDLRSHRPSLLIMAGAGDIDTLVQPVADALNN